MGVLVEVGLGDAFGLDLGVGLGVVGGEGVGIDLAAPGLDPVDGGDVEEVVQHLARGGAARAVDCGGQGVGEGGVAAGQVEGEAAVGDGHAQLTGGLEDGADLGEPGDEVGDVLDDVGVDDVVDGAAGPRLSARVRSPQTRSTSTRSWWAISVAGYLRRRVWVSAWST